MYWANLTSQDRTKISFTGTMSPNEPAKEGPLSYVLLESPFASVSTVSSGHPYLVSMVLPLKWLSSRQLEDSDQDLGAAFAWHMRSVRRLTSRRYTRMIIFLLVFCSSCVGIVRLRMQALFKYLSKDPDVIFEVE